MSCCHLAAGVANSHSSQLILAQTWRISFWHDSSISRRPKPEMLARDDPPKRSDRKDMILLFCPAKWFLLYRGPRRMTRRRDTGQRPGFTPLKN
ncbi:hypothetical protein BgiMline_002700 [Biomphalaria glabrata]